VSISAQPLTFLALTTHVSGLRPLRSLVNLCNL
jgi:hypothetical protein